MSKFSLVGVLSILYDLLNTSNGARTTTEHLKGPLGQVRLEATHGDGK